MMISECKYEYNLNSVTANVVRVIESNKICYVQYLFSFKGTDSHW